MANYNGTVTFDFPGTCQVELRSGERSNLIRVPMTPKGARELQEFLEHLLERNKDRSYMRGFLLTEALVERLENTRKLAAATKASAKPFAVKETDIL